MALRAALLALNQKCILGKQYIEKLTIPLISSSTRSATFVVQNFNRISHRFKTSLVESEGRAFQNQVNVLLIHLSLNNIISKIY